MIGKFKKTISILLTVLLLLHYAVYPTLSFAQEVTSAANADTPTPTPTPVTIDNSSAFENQTTDTPTPTPTPVTIDNSSAVENQTDVNSSTGNNTVDISPTPAPDDDQTITPTSTPDQDDTLNTNYSANLLLDQATPSAGDNESSNSTQNPTGNAIINTGNAVSNTTVENDVNTTSVNSNVVNQTINIFVTQDGDINLFDPYIIASSAIQVRPDDPLINISAVNVNNFAYLDNNVVSFANTGNNSILNAENAIINTGNAYSAVSILNKVNFTIINSEVHIVTINLFGKLNGNIILPDLNISTNCSDCGVNLNEEDRASVDNNIVSSANSGDNSVIASGSAVIATGNSQSAINNLNIVNTNLVGVNATVLYINDFGNWNGNFIGWSGYGPQSGDQNLVLSSISSNTILCASCSGTVNLDNHALVTNNILSFANTGNNSINGGNSIVTTGNAYSVVSLFNFINSSFINSSGFFGFINIFGDWNGSIGGKSEFAALASQDNQTVDSPQSNQSQTMEQGGALTIDQSNNVGQFVYPGDTVTFFANTRNTGSGKVYNVNLVLYLIKNGINVGSANYVLGDIPAGDNVKITTEIALPKNFLSGNYTARVVATGNVGPSNSLVSASSDSNFTVFGNIITITSNDKTQTLRAAVLGTNNKTYYNSARNSLQSLLYFSLLVLIVFSYISIRLIRKKEYIFQILNSYTFKEKLVAFRMFLL
jgi:hypothetical protein